MNKKYFWSLLTFMMVAMLSISFTACGSDDDNDNGANGTVVGKWLRQTSSLKEELHVKADGTWIVYWQEKTSSETVSGEESGTWEIDAHSKILTIITINGEKPGSRTYTYKLEGNTMSLTRTTDGKVTTYTRM